MNDDSSPREKISTPNPKTPQDLLKADPKPRDRTSAFSLAHLTAYTVYWLNNWDIPTTYENISVLNARLFPNDFGLSGFPDLPDAMRTNRTLLQMRPKYRGFATSDPRKGVIVIDLAGFVDGWQPHRSTRRYLAHCRRHG